LKILLFANGNIVPGDHCLPQVNANKSSQRFRGMAADYIISNDSFARSIAMHRWLVALAVGFAVTNFARAQDNLIRIQCEKTSVNSPLTIPLSVPMAWAKFEEIEVEALTGKEAARVVGQLTAPGIMTESIKAKDGLVRRDLHVVLKAPCKELIAHFKETKPQLVRFGWLGKKDEYAELVQTYSGKYVPFLRYVDRPYDASSSESRDKTYKVFHHLYDPAGKRFVTNGGFADDNVTDPKKLLFPHHRGIMYGFNKCSYGPDLKQQADTWHCPPPSADNKKKVPTAHVSHEKTLNMEAGPVLGRHRVLLGWYGAEEKPFALEERELTVYSVKGGTLLEFASRLRTTGGKIRVDGDPQHAGFQFRAANDVADKKIAAQTYYLRPDGKGKPGETRNWDPKTKDGPVDLPWDAMSFVLDGKRYTVCYLNHPSNPKETRFSERDYGRFGGYFQADITEETPLVVHYRLWLQDGEMTQEQASALRTAFASQPKTTVK
jgi:Methane oxygenase PmoA